MEKVSVQTLLIFISVTSEIIYQNHTNIETSVKGVKNKVLENYEESHHVVQSSIFEIYIL